MAVCAMSCWPKPCSRPCTCPRHAGRLAHGLQHRTPPLAPRLADTRCVRPDLHPATRPDAAQSAKLRASPRYPTRQNGQSSNPESRSRWIKVWGNVNGRTAQIRHRHAAFSLTQDREDLRLSVSACFHPEIPRASCGENSTYAAPYYRGDYRTPCGVTKLLLGRHRIQLVKPILSAPSKAGQSDATFCFKARLTIRYSVVVVRVSVAKANEKAKTIRNLGLKSLRNMKLVR